MLAANQLINKILQTRDYDVIKQNSLEARYFVGYQDEFQFIVDHYKKYGNIPDIVTFLSKFEKFDLQDVSETNDFLVEKVFEEQSFSKFSYHIPKLIKAVEEDARLGYEYYKEMDKDIKPRAVCKGVDIIANCMERYDLYKNRANEPEAATIKTGLQELDEIFGGWEYGDELVTVVARTNQGKSWLLMKFLAEAWKQGKKVGLYSGEMNHVKLGYRFDALFKHFSNRALVQGAQTDGYYEYMQEIKQKTNPFIIITQKEFGGKPTVAKIRTFIEENNIEIMGIDQFSLMEDGRATSRDQTRIRLSHIAEDLFLLSSEYKIPILGLAQANREGANKDDQTQAPGLENIKESDDIAHNSSKCIGMRQSSFGLVLDIIKNREGRVGDKLLYSWDIDTGHFAYIPSADDAARPSTRQQFTQQDRQIFEQAASISPF